MTKTTSAMAAGRAIGTPIGQLLARALPLAVPLYLATLVLAAIPAAFVMAAVGVAAGDRPWRAGLLDPSWLNLVVEALGLIATPSAYVDDARLRAGLFLFLLGLLVGMVAVVLNGVVYAFLAGGILERLRPVVEPAAGARPRVPLPEAMAVDERTGVAAPDGGRPDGGRVVPGFWAASRRWFWPFVRLGLLGMVVYGVLAIAAAFVLAWLQRLLSPTVAFVLQMVWLSLLAGWLELARAWMVRRDDRAAWRGLRAATRLAFRSWPPIIWLVLALPGSGLLLAQAWAPFAGDPSSLLGILASLVAAQVVALAGAWLKVVRLGIALRLVPAVLSEQASEQAGAWPPDGRWGIAERPQPGLIPPPGASSPPSETPVSEGIEAPRRIGPRR